MQFLFDHDTIILLGLVLQLGARQEAITDTAKLLAPDVRIVGAHFNFVACSVLSSARFVANKVTLHSWLLALNQWWTSFCRQIRSSEFVTFVEHS